MTAPTLLVERRRGASHPGSAAGAERATGGEFGVAALIRDRLARAALSEGLRGTARVSFCASRAHLIDVTAATFPRAVILEVGDSDEAAFEMTVEQLRAMFPEMTLLAYCVLTPDAMRSVVRAGRAHLNDVIFRGVDDAGLRLRAVLAGAEGDRVTALVMAEIADVVPEPARLVVQYCLRKARSRPTVDDVALTLDVSRQGLAKRLAQARVPPASRLLVWCRLLHAARLVEQPRSSVDAVALELGFGSGAALRHALRRYTGFTPGEVRERGGLRCVLAAFRDALLQQRSLFATAADDGAETSAVGRVS